MTKHARKSLVDVLNGHDIDAVDAAIEQIA